METTTPKTLLPQLLSDMRAAVVQAALLALAEDLPERGERCDW